MKFKQIPVDTFKKLQLSAGVLLSNFDPQTASVDSGDILGATTGGVNFAANPSYTDLGEDIDNCPKNMKELKHLDNWDVRLSGTFLTIDTDTAKLLVGAADVSGDKITPRNSLNSADFSDIWWVGDYSDDNSDETGGFVAIHLMNGLSTGGFQIQTTDNAKGNFAFDITGHYTMTEQDKVPFELFVKAGT